jgi:hypothetical protein
MRPDGVLTLCFDSGLLDAIERTSLFLRRPEWEIRVNGRSIHIRRRSARNVTGSSNNATTTESELVTNADEARRYGREHTHCERCNSGEPRRASFEDDSRSLLSCGTAKVEAIPATPGIDASR